MSELILAVDDEPLVLRSYARTLGEQFTLVTADSPEAALEILGREQIAVILSDLRMPVMDGVSFLLLARQLQPDAVRMMISGHADLGDAINSVNQASIFRLMLKPCPTEEIAASLTAGLEQYRLLTAERQLLEGTLNGAIQALTDILGILDPEAFGQAQLRRALARNVAQALKQPSWTFEVAAQLADIGRATLPPTLNEKLKTGQSLNAAELALAERIPEFSSRLLQRIPRMQAVTEALLYQDKQFNGKGFPEGKVAGNAIPLVARVIHAIKALLAQTNKGIAPAEAISLLKQGPEHYDPAVVLALYATLPVFQNQPKPGQPAGQHPVMMSKLAAGMTLMADLTTPSGTRLLASGTLLSELHVQRIRNYAKLNPITEPIQVM
ncbi:MAG: hypothetical protein RL376_1475 [Verrucomicrobiota bacterium]|jgi:response regulator RpfG family c-di-GMP phosphodiesterase